MERCIARKKAAETMKITAKDLKKLGVIDEIVPEVRGGAHRNVDEQAKYIDDVLQRSLRQLLPLSAEQLIAQRYEKYKKIGDFIESQQHVSVM